ncbi:MAG TPA: helix-turn-helix domain-containing protein [Terriglobia bacterium]|nr:helix-turn-helix domain-containing protein [Terriglobia bacterium]
MKREKKPKLIEIGVITKLLRILEALHSSSGPPGLTLKQISQGAGVNKSTAYRVLTHLAREGYLVRTEAGVYRVGPKLERFGASRTAEAQVETGREPFPPGEARS